MNDDVIEITSDCLVRSEIKGKSKYDLESEYKYLNPFFFFIGAILIFIFYLQIRNGLFELPGDKVDFSNFTYKYSDARNGGNIYGIFTSMFLHGGFEHLIGNMIYLYIFALIIYRLLGLFESILIFVITGIFAGMASYFFNDMPSLGASGAIFGLFGFLSAFFILNRNKISENTYDLSYVLVVLAIFQIGLGLSTPYIDNFAHLGGYISGILIGFLYFKLIDTEDKYICRSPAKKIEPRVDL